MKNSLVFMSVLTAILFSGCAIKIHEVKLTDMPQEECAIVVVQRNLYLEKIDGKKRGTAKWNHAAVAVYFEPGEYELKVSYSAWGGDSTDPVKLSATLPKGSISELGYVRTRNKVNFQLVPKNKEWLAELFATFQGSKDWKGLRQFMRIE